MKKPVLSLVLLLLFGGMLQAQLANGNRTLLHTQTAKSVEKGRLEVFSNMNFYTKAGDFIGASKPLDFETVNYWLVAGNTVFSYGITDHFDASLGIRVYQDTHYPNEYNLPDDIFLTLKAGSFPFGRGHFNSSIMTSFRIPTAEQHNYPLAQYASGAFEFGFLGAVSFYLDPYLPQRAFNMHFNMGIWNHNESGKVLYTYTRNFAGHLKGDELKATRSSMDFRMALATVFPSELFDFRVELSGILYLTKPNSFVYSVEEWAFLSPSIRYKPLDWISLDLGADFRISPKERQQTSTEIPDFSTSIDLPGNYPDWKIHLGANIALNLVGKSTYKAEDYAREKAKERIELFESVVKEEERAKEVQKEIENLRRVREEAESEIEEIKKMLEEDE